MGCDWTRLHPPLVGAPCGWYVLHGPFNHQLALDIELEIILTRSLSGPCPEAGGAELGGSVIGQLEGLTTSTTGSEAAVSGGGGCSSAAHVPAADASLGRASPVDASSHGSSVAARKGGSSTILCLRCMRQGHLAPACYAQTHALTKAPLERQEGVCIPIGPGRSHVCKLCGRRGHKEERCASALHRRHGSADGRVAVAAPGSDAAPSGEEGAA